MSVMDILSGIKVLKEVDSSVNGRLKVVKDLAWGVHIQAGGVTQSGGVAVKVWETVLRKVKGKRSKVKNVLVLGLGAGGVVKPIKKYWPDADIVGVEIDKTMVDLGKKYFGLDEHKVQIHIQDAVEFLDKNKKKYDLVCVDMYLGQQVPNEFDTEEFAQRVSELVHENGVVVFNRLYFGEKRKLAEKFHRKLIGVFGKVRPIYPEANVMYVCISK